MKNPLLSGIVLLCFFTACKKPDVLPSQPAPPVTNPTDPTKPVMTFNYYTTDTAPRLKGLVVMSPTQYQSLPYFDETTLHDVPANGNINAIPLPQYALNMPMVNQRGIPASAAFAAGFAVNSYNYFASHYPITWWANGYPDTTKHFNPLFIYNQLPQEIRRNLYDVFQFLKERGISNMQDMPFYYDRDTTRIPTETAQANALNHKITGAYRLKKYDIDLLKKLVYAYGHPVIIGVTLDNAYERLSKACFRAVNVYDTGSKKTLTWIKYLQASDPSSNPSYEMQRSLQALVVSGYDDEKHAF